MWDRYRSCPYVAKGLASIRVGPFTIIPKTTGAILDSGTCSTTLPSTLADIVNKEIGRIRYDKRAYLPNIKFTLAGYDFKLGPYDYTTIVEGHYTSRII